MYFAYLYTYYALTSCILFFPCLDVQCNKLIISDGLKIYCDNGLPDPTGVGYVGDTCIFTCAVGFILSGSVSRTCQSDRSWSGTESTCIRGGYSEMYVYPHLLLCVYK